ncbi:MAG: phage major tail tube protein [bacterium]|nr:phage major tail tube protein [bacterium]
MDIRGAINGDTVYNEGTLVAKDVKITLPEVTPATTEAKAMGTMELPMRGQIESMESSITRIGVDMGLAKLMTMDSKTIEVRWAQEVTKADGSTNIEGCKAFLRCVPKVLMPGMDIEPGGSVETEIPLAVTRYQLYIGGQEVCCIDRLSQICRINGKDYYSEIASVL